MPTLDPLSLLGQLTLGQTVDPNPKCNGCLHYDAQRGRGGVCTIGLRPFTCGTGDMPLIGYAPMDSLVADFQPMAPRAQVSDGGDGKDTVTIAVKTITLGEEHVDLVKSHIRNVAPLSGQTNDRHGISSRSTASFRAVPTASPNERVVVKALLTQLNNAERFVLGDTAEAAITSFVHHVVKGEHDVDVLHSLVVNDGLVKGFYGHEWLSQFKGTELFNDAVELCEEDIRLEEERIKRERVVSQRQREIAAKLKVGEADYWPQRDEALAQLRLKKDKLQLKLAKIQQKNLTSA